MRISGVDHTREMVCPCVPAVIWDFMFIFPCEASSSLSHILIFFLIFFKHTILYMSGVSYKVNHF